MGLGNEYSVPNSGVTDILNACPEFDVMVSAHEHRQMLRKYDAQDRKPYLAGWIFRGRDR